jgi:hypothetical protein
MNFFERQAANRKAAFAAYVQIFMRPYLANVIELSKRHVWELYGEEEAAKYNTNFTIDNMAEIEAVVLEIVEKIKTFQKGEWGLKTTLETFGSDAAMWALGDDDVNLPEWSKKILWPLQGKWIKIRANGRGYWLD